MRSGQPKADPEGPQAPALRVLWLRPSGPGSDRPSCPRPPAGRPLPTLGSAHSSAGGLRPRGAHGPGSGSHVCPSPVPTFCARASSSAWTSNSPSSESLPRAWAAASRRFRSPFFLLRWAMAGRDRGRAAGCVPAAMRTRHRRAGRGGASGPHHGEAGGRPGRARRVACVGLRSCPAAAPEARRAHRGPCPAPEAPLRGSGELGAAAPGSPHLRARMVRAAPPDAGWWLWVGARAPVARARLSRESVRAAPGAGPGRPGSQRSGPRMTWGHGCAEVPGRPRQRAQPAWRGGAEPRCSGERQLNAGARHPGHPTVR